MTSPTFERRRCRTTPPASVLLRDGGADVCLRSVDATSVSCCVIDADGTERAVPMWRGTQDLWHCSVPQMAAGSRYGFRVGGPFQPEVGLVFDPTLLLLDPYARAVESTPDGHRSVVVDETYDWGTDTPPGHRWCDTVIYEAHVRGLTALHPLVPEEQRGTYAGLAHPAVIEHLQRLGVTTLELLPVHAHTSEEALAARGLTNYWGYNTLSFFAPHTDFGSGPVQTVLTEFKNMVAALHRAGIEVILDVVYNHTCEGDPTGPTTSLRGIDNRSYYRLDGHDQSRYADFTGCGNTLDTRERPALALVTDSLRYWVQEMHVDGFRFDLAPALARRSSDFDPRAPFLDLLALDPVLSQVKLIAEPWDAVGGGYQLGRFGAPWAEWNDRFRDDVRDFWCGTGSAAALSARLAGSSDVFGDRAPLASVNFVTAHDGFSLADLVSYEHKHNEANGENNRDGAWDNRSSNGGVEGHTDDPAVLAGRRRRARSILATLLLAPGVPMLLGGDELGRTQNGNNNAYCQDNKLSYLDWDLDEERGALLRFTSRVLALRAEYAALRPAQPLTGEANADGVPDVTWFSAARQRSHHEDWPRADDPTLGMLLTPTYSDRMNTDRSDAVLIIAHSDDAPVQFTLPAHPWAARYVLELDTAFDEADEPAGSEFAASQTITVAADSLLMFRVLAPESIIPRRRRRN